VTRDELIARTRQLVEEGARLQEQPSFGALQIWLQLSDDLLSTAWGSMDRYHLAWLMVGKPKSVIRGRPMTSDEEADYVREVADQKTAALRMSLDAVERQGMPFVGETGAVAAGQGMGTVPGTTDATSGDTRSVDARSADARSTDARSTDARTKHEGRLPAEGGLSERVREARQRALEHEDHDRPRAPRPDRMQR
jgi:hypothetical protein